MSTSALPDYRRTSERALFILLNLVRRFLSSVLSRVKLGSTSSSGGRVFTITRSGISSLHSMNPADPNSKLQPFRRTSPMKLSRAPETASEHHLEYVNASSIASTSNSSIISTSRTVPASSIASNNFHSLPTVKSDADRAITEQ